MNNNLSARLGNIACNHPYWTVLLSIFLICASTYGGIFLGFTSNYQTYFGKDNPQLVAYEQMQNVYSKSTNVLMIIAPKDGHVFNPNTLKMVKELTEKAWQLPYATRVDSITNFQHSIAQDDDLIVNDLVPSTENLSPEQLAAIKQTALNDPLLSKRLISPEADVTAVNVTVYLPEKNPQEVIEVGDAAKKLAGDFKQSYPDIDTHLTGMIMLNHAFAEVAEYDSLVLTPIMLLIILLCIGLLLRSLYGTVIVLLVILSSVLMALGTIGWLHWQINPSVAVAPTIILTMAVADCVHLLTSFFHFMNLGFDKKGAIKESIRVNLQPVFITSLTTAIGFMSLNFSDSPPFRMLGNTVALGVMFAFVLSVTLLPALLTLLPIKSQAIHKKYDAYMQNLALFVIKRRNFLLAANSLIAVILISFIPMNQLNDEFVRYFDESTDFRQATDFSAQHLGGVYTIEYSLESRDNKSINDPDFLNQLGQFVDWARAQPEVIHVKSISDTFKRLNKNMHGDEASFYRLPENRELAAQYLLLYEMSLPYGLDLNDQINIDKVATRITLTLKNMSSNQMLNLEQSINTWLAKNAPDIKSTPSSPTLMFAHIGERNIKSMLIGTALALLLISLILLLVLRSFKIGLLSLIPNLLPAAATFGLWALINGMVGMGLSIVAGMTIGIVVDDTVHFLSKYLRAKREKNYDTLQAVSYSFSSIGTALITTTLVLVAGFMVLTLSPFSQSVDMGIMTAITISFALWMDFLLLPPLLISLDK